MFDRPWFDSVHGSPFRLHSRRAMEDGGRLVSDILSERRMVESALPNQTVDDFGEWYLALFPGCKAYYYTSRTQYLLSTQYSHFL